jgi:hypothetical protein
MKKVAKFGVLVAAIFFIFCGSAMAVTFTWSDTPPDFTDSWPGYIQAGYDNIGNPQVASISATINDITRNLEIVQLNMTNRSMFDSLFINTGGDGLPYEAWDFFVREGDGLAAALYTVASSYTYQITAFPFRPDHPVGFLSGITPDALGRLASVVWTPTTLTYNFNPGIYMNRDFTIGYTQYCANEVVLTSPVAEPISLLLLGLGLVGVSVMRRKFRN